MLSPRLTWLLLGALNVSIVVVACGARTGLPIPEREEATGGSGGEGGGGAPPGPPPDAPPDTPPDVPPPPPDDCKDPSTTFIYLVTGENTLWSFNPENLAFTEIGFPDCEVPSDWSPFSMGVDRKGTAYVLYRTTQLDGNLEVIPGQLFRVSTVDAKCEATDFEPGQLGFDWFGMGFSLDEAGGKTDSLYVAEINFDTPSMGLATIDTETLEMSFIGGFTDPPGPVLEMTGSSDGALYAYFTNKSGGSVVEFDKTNAAILAETPLPVGQASSSLAFAFWNGDFYIFTSEAGGGVTTVTRYQPSNGSVGVVTTLNQTVVGAGVSTCDPLAFE